MNGVWTPEDIELRGVHGLSEVHRHRDGELARTFLTSDKTLLEDAVTSVALGKNLLLRGPTGSGKTRLAESMAARFGLSIEAINCSVDLDAEALLGFKTLDVADGKNAIRYVEGPVVRAMQSGSMLYIDEINMARPETLPILNSLLDYRRQLTNPFTAQTISAHPNFRVIAAINEGYVGTMPMNEALKNRFVIVDVPYLQGDVLARLIRGHTEGLAEQAVDWFVGLSADLVAAARSGQLSEEAASIRALLDACDLAVYIPPLRAIAHAIAAKLDDERERAVVMNLANTYFPA
jgi:MoxR-like ATPase